MYRKLLVCNPQEPHDASPRCTPQLEKIMEKHKAVNMRANVMNQPLTLNSLLPILKAIGLIDDDFNESELIDKLLNDT